MACCFLYGHGNFSLKIICTLIFKSVYSLLCNYRNTLAISAKEAHFCDGRHDMGHFLCV